MLAELEGTEVVYVKTGPKGILVFKCDVGNCIFSKSWEFLKILWEFFSYGRKLFVCKDFGFCQDFVSMHKNEGGRRTKDDI